MDEEILKKSDDVSYASHQKWGGTYLIVADESEEFSVALKYATQMANRNKCRVGVLRVLETQDFMHWGNVEKRMRNEQREQAEKMLNRACFLIHEFGGKLPTVYMEKGPRIDALTRAIEGDSSISMLILAGRTHGTSPGPLVSHFTGKGLGRLRVPVLVVPDHYDI